MVEFSTFFFSRFLLCVEEERGGEAFSVSMLFVRKFPIAFPFFLSSIFTPSRLSPHTPCILGLFALLLK